MRDYQRQKNNPYKLPHNLHKRMIYTALDYPRIKSERDEIMHGEYHGKNPTEDRGIRLASMESTCEAIEKALQTIPKEYRKGVWGNVVERKPYPIDAGESTYARYRAKFLYMVAKNLGEI